MRPVGMKARCLRRTLYMYQRYAETQGWKFEVLDLSPSDLGGCKEAIVNVTGQDVYKRLKYESGVHRVQRVPATEAQGRIHTSTVTVAVLPEAAEVDAVRSNRKTSRSMSAAPPGTGDRV